MVDGGADAVQVHDAAQGLGRHPAGGRGRAAQQRAHEGPRGAVGAAGTSGGASVQGGAQLMPVVHPQETV
ncbi:hypothetical protein GCM10009528_12940 [Kineococcus aurantiacus]